MKDIEYIYSLRKYILAATGVFLISLIAGLVVSVKNPGISENYFEMFKKSFGWITTLDPLNRMLEIFMNNVRSSLMALLLGTAFGLVPLALVVFNGLLLGMVIELISVQKGVIFVLAATLPHGIVEIPSILISAAIGIRLGHQAYLYLKGSKTALKQELKQGIWFYLSRIAPLLFVAAAIETFITPFIAMQFS